MQKVNKDMEKMDKSTYYTIYGNLDFVQNLGLLFITRYVAEQRAVNRKYA